MLKTVPIPAVSRVCDRSKVIKFFVLGVYKALQRKNRVTEKIQNWLTGEISLLGIVEDTEHQYIPSPELQTVSWSQF